MSKPFSLIFDTTAHASKLNEVKAAILDLVQDVNNNEPDVVSYDCYIDDKTSRVCVMESYQSSEALLAHLGRKNVNTALEAIMQKADVNNVTILGEVTPAVHDAMAPFNAQYLNHHAGFNRLSHPTKIEASHKPTT